jgi:protein arginine kinase
VSDWGALVATPCAWLSDAIPPGGVVVSTRIRLARNLTGRSFPQHARRGERRALLQEILDKTQNLTALDGGHRLELARLDPNQRRFLGERQLVSPELVESPEERGVVLAADQTLSFMINEEDHLRVQAIRPGLDLDGAWRPADALDDDLDGRLDFAYSDALGFLTACPTNVGTGMRASVLAHLPAVVLNKDLDKLVEALRGERLAIRGFYGEGSAALGNFFQVSNGTTLGLREADILGKLDAAAADLAGWEERARDALLSRARGLLEDKIWRSYAILRHARVLSAQEALNHVSLLRLGVSLGFLPIPTRALNEILLHALPAHSQLQAGAEDGGDVEVRRATMVREKLQPYDS